MEFLSTNQLAMKKQRHRVIQRFGPELWRHCWWVHMAAGPSGPAAALSSALYSCTSLQFAENRHSNKQFLLLSHKQIISLEFTESSLEKTEQYPTKTFRENLGHGTGKVISNSWLTLLGAIAHTVILSSH